MSVNQDSSRLPLAQHRSLSSAFGGEVVRRLSPTHSSSCPLPQTTCSDVYAQRQRNSRATVASRRIRVCVVGTCTNMGACASSADPPTDLQQRCGGIGGTGKATRRSYDAVRFGAVPLSSFTTTPFYVYLPHSAQRSSRYSFRSFTKTRSFSGMRSC